LTLCERYYEDISRQGYDIVWIGDVSVKLYTSIKGAGKVIPAQGE